LKPKHILKLLKRLIKMVRFEPDDREQAIIKEILAIRMLAVALKEGYDFKLIKLKNQHAYRIKLIKPKKHKARK